MAPRGFGSRLLISAWATAINGLIGQHPVSAFSPRNFPLVVRDRHLTAIEGTVLSLKLPGIALKVEHLYRLAEDEPGSLANGHVSEPCADAGHLPGPSKCYRVSALGFFTVVNTGKSRLVD